MSRSINAAVLAVAVVALVFSPATVSAHVRVTELAVLVAGALALLAVNVCCCGAYSRPCAS